uniref:Mos1 transposase HTH domain-containing protein n=1 Tax=Acrobeloides nanus TaxID=290746 RepID=A0A914DUH9_9BILA
MVISNLKKHLRHVLLWLYDKDNSISKRAASKELREVYGNEGFGDNVCGIWLKRFRDGNKNIDDLDDKPRSGRPSTLNDEELRLLVEMDPKATVRELAEVLQKSVSTGLLIASELDEGERIRDRSRTPKIDSRLGRLKTSGFLGHGLHGFAERWAKVVEYEGDYFPED